MSVLLHACCGPCACFPLKYLKEHGYDDIVGYFYNPNIHPYKEFKRRLDTFIEFAEKTQLDIEIDAGYELEQFIKKQLECPEGRCVVCYETRLHKAAYFAKQQGFEYFTTTLLVSPYQKHDLIRQIGEKIADQVGVKFLYIDFRQGYHEGVKISKDLELYRQPYCGCIFSERDRYYKPKKVKSDV